jgi:hypothetical protein
MKDPFDSLNPSKWKTMNDIAEGITQAGAMGLLDNEDEQNQDNTNEDDTKSDIIEDENAETYENNDK